MMLHPLMIYFTIGLVAETTKALIENYPYSEQYGNDSFIQQRQHSLSDVDSKITPILNFRARSLGYVIITTPQYPKKYKSSTTLNWNVKAATGDIELFCDVFNLRPKSSKGCRDYLQAQYKFGGDFITKKFCGTTLNGIEIIFPTDQIYLKFKASARRNSKYQGFNCTISSSTSTGTFSTSTGTSTSTSTSITDCNCGVYIPPIDTDGKVVGGSTTEDNQFPWQALMVRKHTDFLECGGSLINDQFVLTASHCTYGRFKSKHIQILLGVQCWSNTPPEKLRIDVIKIIEHERYNDATFDNDIALLKLKDKVDFINTQFRPVCLPVTNTDPIPDEDDVEAAISGLGALEHGGPYPDCLQYAIVPTMTNTLCQDLYPDETITSNMICAGFPSIGEIDACQGDSGGPIVTNATSYLVDYYVQIGVVSWGYGCAHPDFPGVYARVSESIDWINTHTAGFSTCSSP